jgi:hypothetical protein
MNEPQIMVCQKCGRVLDFYESLSESEPSSYRHTYQDQARADHEPVPIPATNTNVKARCDFCNDDILSPDQVWTVPVKTFEMPVEPHMRRLFPPQISEGDWAACQICAELIGTEQWDDLATRASHDDPVNRKILLPLYRALRENITGKPFKEGV